ncbi:cytochrome P450 monooxygenase-like protein [Lindgomyces ingoldianus]|uniref:Cytochrome P450 monooxygenase-like protein n=1 Tax=Lindgomyces ingoldianus TaxID=673940 RepID=A0ACB6QBP5_9PLEO|nr:cytochrome P450 monooxygenase-like protein [Lindgomyces ingoldianus]KAF2464018.1 cytochrome P450 monooxygenase-like protein [Lindgomyces ingoldianus]
MAVEHTTSNVLDCSGNTSSIRQSELSQSTTIFLRLAYLAFLHPLSKYPGPKLWAISRIPWAYHVIKGDVWHSFDKFHDQYGPVVRIAPDELTYITPEAWKDIYTAKPDLNKDPYSLTPPLNGANSLFTALGDDHKRIRGAFINAFSDKALREQSSIIEEYAQQLIQRMKAELHGSPSQIVDIQRIIGYAVFDIISDLTWGESPGTLQTTGDQNWVTRFFLHAQFSTVRNCLSRFPPLDRILYYVFLRVTSKQRIANTKLTTERINRRLAAGHSRSDFMTPIIGKISEKGHKGITKSEVLTNGLAVIIANSQLTTIAITSAMYFLLRHPKQLRLAAEEVANVGFHDESDIKVATTQPLPYLNAVISETLRLHHPTPGNLPRVAPKGGMMIAGRFVPGGSVIGVSLYNIHTRSENFKAPLEFHPERFLEKADARYDPAFQDDRLDAFQPFSMGQRNCIGSKIFLAEARVFLARLIWAFDMELAEQDASSWLDQKAWLVYEPKPLKVRLQER